MRTKVVKGQLLAHRVFPWHQKMLMEKFVDEQRLLYPGATVRTFHRDVRVDGLTVPLRVVVVREKLVPADPAHAKMMRDFARSARVED